MRQHDDLTALVADAPRVLFFSPFPLADPRSGGERRAAQAWTLLRAQGCAVEAIVHARPRQEVNPSDRRTHRLEVGHGAQRFFDPRLRRLFRSRIASFRPDLVWIEQFYSVPQMAGIARQHKVPVVYNAANVEVERFAAWPLPQRAAIAWYERHLLRKVDWCACVCARDRDLLSARYGFDPARCHVLPNAYDEAEFHPAPADGETRAGIWGAHGVPTEGKVLVFPGNQSYAPNVAAREWLCAQLAPEIARSHPDARIALLGPELPGRMPAIPNVLPLGFVADLAAHLRAADLLVCPLLHGGGSRLKIIEALACGLPVLSTPKGAEGLEGIGEDAGLYRAPLEDFAARLTALLAAPLPRRDTPHPAVAALGMGALGAGLREFVDVVARAGRGDRA